jgi:hypothetical protein
MLSSDTCFLIFENPDLGSGYATRITEPIVARENRQHWAHSQTK